MSYDLASNHIPRIQLLREEGRTWKEVVEWFHNSGIDFTVLAAQAAWFKHQRRLRRYGAVVTTAKVWREYYA